MIFYALFKIVKKMCFENKFLFVAIICLSLLSLDSSLRCQQGSKTKSESLNINDITELSCPSNASYECHRYDVNFTASGTSGKKLTIHFQRFYKEYFKYNLLTI